MTTGTAFKCTWAEQSSGATPKSERLAQLIDVDFRSSGDAAAALPASTASSSKIRAYFSRSDPSGPPCEISVTVDKACELRTINVVSSARVCEVYIDGSYWETFRGNTLEVLDDVQLFQICITGKAVPLKEELSLRLLSLRSNKSVLFFSSMHVLLHTIQSTAPSSVEANTSTIPEDKGHGPAAGKRDTQQSGSGMETFVMHAAMAMEARVVKKLEQVVKDFEQRMKEKLDAMEARMMERLSNSEAPASNLSSLGASQGGEGAMPNAPK